MVIMIAAEMVTQELVTLNLFTADLARRPADNFYV